MKSILVVDDELNMREILEDALSADYAIATAANGHEALELLAGQDFDLIITDVMMPEMDGIELLLAMQKIKPEQKFVAISGGSSIGGQFDCLKAASLLGRCAGLRKPFRMSELRAMVGDLLALNEPHDSHRGAMESRQTHN
jgi:DNA-binding NtrC family response regulator